MQELFQQQKKKSLILWNSCISLDNFSMLCALPTAQWIGQRPLQGVKQVMEITRTTSLINEMPLAWRRNTASLPPCTTRIPLAARDRGPKNIDAKRVLGQGDMSARWEVSEWAASWQEPGYKCPCKETSCPSCLLWKPTAGSGGCTGRLYPNPVPRQHVFHIETADLPASWVQTPEGPSWVGKIN